PGGPPVVGLRDERQRVALLGAPAVAVLDEPRRCVELHLDLARMTRVVRLHRTEVLQRLFRACLDQLSRFQRGKLPRAELADALLDRDGGEPVAEEPTRLAPDRLLAGAEAPRAAPVATERGVAPRLAARPPFNLQSPPRLPGDGVRHHAVGRPDLRVHADEERRVDALLEELGVLGPVV